MARTKIPPPPKKEVSNSERLWQSAQKGVRCSLEGTCLAVFNTWEIIQTSKAQ